MDSESVSRAVRAKVESLQVRLLAKVESNLSGDVLQVRSGRLKGSIVADLDVDGDVIKASVASVGVPYAAIQEYGGQTAPHEILPVKAQALAFVGVGGQVFARRVQHPGSQIPARSYLGSALDALHADIAGGLKESVRAALGAS